MELELCGSACGSDGDVSSSEGEDKELEEELYSVLHYSDFSNGVPEELKQKYDIVLKGTECSIQQKNSSESCETDTLANASLSSSIEIDEGSSSSDSSVNEIVILERDPFPVRAPPSSSPVYETLSSDMNSDNSLSDSDSSDLIVLEDPNRRSPILLSDEDDIKINLDLSEEENGSMSDGQVSDVVGGSSYDWQKVSSPSTWSDSMRKYYNRPCSTLRYFDFRKIKNELMNVKEAKWHINNGDKYKINIPRRRCHICRQPGHIAQSCPKRYPVCLMCGTEGHTLKECPDSKCLNCGRQAGSYVTMCNRCKKTSGTLTCFTCQQRGHWAKDCPNNWRQFHSITGDDSNLPQSDASVNPNANCSNCGGQGHFYEKCRKGYFSPYPPVTSLVTTAIDRTFVSNAQPNGPRKKRKMGGAPNVSRDVAPERKRFKRGGNSGKGDFFRHLGPRSRSVPRQGEPDSQPHQGGKNRSKRRKQKRYFNLTA